MAAPDFEHKKSPYPPLLMAVHLAALATIALCIAELFPGRGGQGLGIIRPDLVMPLLGAGISVTLVCAYKMFQTKPRSKREEGSGTNKLP